MNETRPIRRALLIGVPTVGAFVVVIVATFVLTAPRRGALRTYMALIAAADRGDLAAIRELCTARYLAVSPPRLAPGGGVVGLPRGIHKNFRTWRRGEAIWLCPTNRAGPVYRFQPTPEGWRFDGLVGYLRPDGALIRAEQVEQGTPGA